MIGLKVLVFDICSVFLKFANTTKCIVHITNYQKRQNNASHSLTGSRVTSGMVNGGQAALRKLAYSEAAGQTLASMIEWKASETYHC